MITWFDLESEMTRICNLAVTRSICKRKGVAVSIWNVTAHGDGLRLNTATNGQNDGNTCTNEVGNCGCSHAEPAAILNTMRVVRFDPATRFTRFMMCTHSPCTQCAHVICLSNLVSTVIYEIHTDHDPRGIAILKQAGIFVYSMDELSNKPEEERNDIFRKWVPSR